MPSDRLPPRPPAIPWDGPRRAVLAVWAAGTLALGWLVATYQSDVPHGDEFDHVPVVTGHRPLTLGWLWSPHNEHRIPFPRLAQLGLLWATGTDFRVGVWANVAALSGLALTTARVAARLRGRAAWTDAFFPCVWLHWGHVEAALFNFTLAPVLVALLLTAALIVVVRRGSALRPGDVARVSGCLILLVLCGGQGLVPAVLLAGWLGVMAVTGVRWAAVGAAATAVVIGLYFVGFSASGSPPGEVRTVAEIAWGYLAVGFGPGVEAFWPAAGGAMAALLTGAVAAAVAGLRRPGEWRRAAGLLAVLAVQPAFAVLVGYARSGDGDAGNAGLQSRYATLWGPSLCAVYFAVQLYLPGSPGRVARWGLMAIAAAMLGNAVYGLDFATRFRINRAAFERELDAGVPSPVLARRYAGHPFGLYPPDPVALDAWLTMFRDAGVGRFTRLRSMPPHKLVPLGPDNCLAGPEPGRFRLTPGREVFAVYATLKAAGPGGEVVAVSWRGGGAEGRSGVGVAPGWGEYVVWVGGRVEDIRLAVAPGRPMVAVGRVVLAVPADGPASPAGPPSVP